MRCLFFFATALALFTITASAQSLPTYGNTPIEVAEQFWKMESSGGRLSVPGWYKASQFFAAQPSPLTLERDITIVSGDFKVGDPTIKEGRATRSCKLPELPRARAFGFETAPYARTATACIERSASRAWSVVQVHPRSFRQALEV